MLSPIPRHSDWAHHTSLNPPESCQPSPIWQSGRPVHCPFRGLLGVHSRYGLHTRAVTVYRDTLSEGFSHFVTSIAAPVASGWSVCRVGFAPTGKRRLFTAHANCGLMHRSKEADYLPYRAPSFDGASEPERLRPLAIVTVGDHACGCVTTGIWVEACTASLINVPPWPSLEAAKVEAM
jgi:hypothetical protein